MGLAVAWVRVEQQRALLGLHAAAGASWLHSWLHCFFIYILKSSPERMLNVLTEEPAKGLPPQPLCASFAARCWREKSCLIKHSFSPTARV